MATVALSSLYLDPARYDLLAQVTGPADLPFYLELVERQWGTVLELGWRYRSARPAAGRRGRRW